MFDKYKLMVSVLVRARNDYYNLFPEDFTNYGRMSEVIHSVCWKIKDKEDEIGQATNIQTSQ